MLFNSVEFTVFLPTFFLLYWIAFRSSIRARNALILVGSYLFYGWWDWRFLFLIVGSSAIDYGVGIAMGRTDSLPRRRALLFLSLAVNLGALTFFKYHNFFIESAQEAISSLGFQANLWSMKVILPVGISFYTFQTLSYSIDIYRKKLEPTEDVISFFAFVSFFPQLVAGPIERAADLLPQFHIDKKFDPALARSGLRQILWGFFKKIVIADNCAFFVNEIFSLDSGQQSGATLFLGAALFAFQIYGDFSGYSDIAIGTARLLGFQLSANFAYPYFSRNIPEFWRRWHITLSSWFRDYVYIPLGGSYGSKWIQLRNVLITFTVSGLWHGANWTFVVWGFLHGLFYVPAILNPQAKQKTKIVAHDRLLPGLKEVLKIIVTFCVVTIAWVFFRSESVSDAFAYNWNMLRNIADFSVCQELMKPEAALLFAFIALMFGAEWIHRTKSFGLELSEKIPRSGRWAIYLLLITLTILGGRFDLTEFIYFQF